MAKPIMIQGTMSGVGKSLITAGLCRVFKQDGYRTAPFKSQNMALNSYITSEGLEIGRAQAVQAQAAGIAPSAAMNPILLKPTSDVGSQVIVNGQVFGTMSAKEYFAYKQKLVPVIKEAYQTLDASYDLIVIEGAGSPAEINLKQHDIVNMGLAEMLDAPVLLAGDIDRGGVFAQLLGTLLLLEQTERARVKGLIINKFRGDPGILAPGIRLLEQKSGLPVVGTLPYTQLDIEEEDSLTKRFTHTDSENSAQAVDIAVIRLPRISNYTDFRVLEAHPQICLRYVTRAPQLNGADLILLPGTKNTMSDLRWLRASGLEAALLKCHAQGSVIFGICGGYQMLGQHLADPDGTEEGGQMRGIGLLPLQTVFQKDKVTTRVHGRIGRLSGVLAALSGREAAGYEIHMGVTAPYNTGADAGNGRQAGGEEQDYENAAGGIFSTLEVEGCPAQKKADGWHRQNVYGTYVHGIFDADGMADGLLTALAKKRGICLETVHAGSFAKYQQEQFDRLAEMLRAHLDLGALYRMLQI